ncbi:unnamed protein product [Onchocerca ochengi]|uniref:BZIP domain-containing protein n=2 Tax=Onchocerca TaxID=6281 RepID=A0A182EQF7_ONCOC|nr:unnamed protein product [Onchocerca ochengi]
MLPIALETTKTSPSHHQHFRNSGGQPHNAIRPDQWASLLTMASSSMEAGTSSKILSDVDKHPSNSLQRKKRRLHANQRAQLIYQKIIAERKAEKEKRQLEREKREKVLENYTSIKRKMNKALSKKNKRGQPNLNAQIEVLLEKIEKRIEKS